MMVTEKEEKGGTEEKKAQKVSVASEQEKEGKEKKDIKSGVKEKKDVKVEEKSKSQHRIVRLLEYTLNGDKKVNAAVRDIKGIGYRIASILARNLNMEDKLLADLNDDEISRLEISLKNISNIVPAWMVNHRNDQFTGTNLHPVGTDLEIAVRNDIEFMQKIKCYKGIRHTQGQPVRGQRTRTSFRTGKSVGVVKKKGVPAKAGAKEGEGKKASPATAQAKNR